MAVDRWPSSPELGPGAAMEAPHARRKTAVTRRGIIASGNRPRLRRFRLLTATSRGREMTAWDTAGSWRNSGACGVACVLLVIGQKLMRGGLWMIAHGGSWFRSLAERSSRATILLLTSYRTEKTAAGLARTAIVLFAPPPLGKIIWSMRGECARTRASAVMNASAVS